MAGEGAEAADHATRLEELEADSAQSSDTQAELYRILLWADGPTHTRDVYDRAPARAGGVEAVRNNLSRLAERGWVEQTDGGWAIRGSTSTGDADALR